MNKKTTSSALAALMIAGSTSFSAFAAMSNGTVVIGTKAFDLAYANDPKNVDEITNAIVAGGEVYVKDFEGNWINNTTGLTVSASVIPAVIYKNFNGVTTNFDAKDMNGTALALKVEDIKFSNYKTMTITLDEKVSGTPVVKVNGVIEKAENVALSADGMSISVARSLEFAVGTYSVVINGLTHEATNSVIPEATISVVKDASYPATFTNITNAITNLSKDVYLTAVDQYAKAYNISVDSSYKLSVTVNGMPLTASEASLTSVNNMAKVTLSKVLVEKDIVVIKVEKFDKDAADVTAKSLSTLNSAFTVAKDAAAVANTILGVTASASTILAGDATVTLTADVRDQFNNPADLTVNKLRWEVAAGGSLLDTSGDLNSSALTVDKNGNTATFKAVKPGVITINSYNMVNGSKATYTVVVGAAKLTEVTLTSENPTTQYNNEVIKYNKIVQNSGTILTADMVKFNVVAKTIDTVASDITVTATLRGGTAADKNDIVISAKTSKVGTYEVTPFVGTSFDAEGTIKAAKFDVVTTLNPIATKIDAISLPMIKVGTAQKTNLVVRNTHSEVIDVTATSVEAVIYKNGQSSNEIQVEELDKDGQVAVGATVVKALRFNATVAGNYTARVSVAGTVATYDITVSSEVTSLKSIELGNNILDNSVIANATDAVYRVLSVKDNKGDEITPDTTNWVISTKNGSNADVAGFASIVYFKHDATGVIVTATNQADAEGIAVKFAPNAGSVNAYDVDTTLAIAVGNKDLAAADVIKDTLNVTVKAKSAVKTITLADANVSVIPGATVKKEIVVLDQYGKAITDTSMVTLVNGTKVTGALSYDGVAKKMYVTYTGVTTGTDAIVVKSVADATIKATVNVTIGDNTSISSIAFNANSYKVYNSATDTEDQEVALTYKVNGGTLDIPASEITVIADSNLVTVTKDGGTIKVIAKAGVNTAATGIGASDAVITISVLTANGKTSSMDLTFSDDASVVDKATVAIKDTVDESKDIAGVQMIIGKDKDGNVVVETTGQITLLGKDQYGNEKEVQADTTWASANSAVATVSSTGLVTKVAAGNTTVTGFYKGNLYTVEIQVK